MITTMMGGTKFLLMCTLFCCIYFDGVPVSEGKTKSPLDGVLDLADFAQGKKPKTTTTKKPKKTTTTESDESTTQQFSEDTTIGTERSGKKQRWPQWTDSDESESKKFQAQYTRPPRPTKTTVTTRRTTTKFRWPRFSDEED